MKEACFFSNACVNFQLSQPSPKTDNVQVKYACSILVITMYLCQADRHRGLSFTNSHDHRSLGIGLHSCLNYTVQPSHQVIYLCLRFAFLPSDLNRQISVWDVQWWFPFASHRFVNIIILLTFVKRDKPHKAASRREVMNGDSCLPMDMLWFEVFYKDRCLYVKQLKQRFPMCAPQSSKGTTSTSQVLCGRLRKIKKINTEWN